MPLYEIETERLVLRPWRDGDWHGLRRTYGDAEVMRSAWGRGYATEGPKASLAFAFTVLDLPQIFSMTRPDHVRSRAVMERCGLTLRGDLDFHGRHQGHCAIDRRDWPPHDAHVPRMKIREVGER